MTTVDVLAVPTTAGPRIADVTGSDRALRCLVVAAPMLTAGALGLVTILATGAPVTLTVPLLAAWLMLAPGVRTGLRRLDPSDVAPILRHSVTVFAAAAGTLALSAAPNELIVSVALLLAIATCGLTWTVAVLGRLVPWRTLVVGEPGALPPALADIGPAGSGSTVVGAVLVGPREGVPTYLGEPDGLPVAYDVSSTAELVRRWRVDCVAVVPSPAFEAEALRRLAWQLERSPARLIVCVPVLHTVGRQRLSLVRTANATFAGIGSSRVPPLVAAVKTAADRVLGSILLLLLAPAIVLLGALVRLDSPGPAIYRQTRVGRDGRAFTILKLRTMRLNAESEVAGLMERDEGNGVLFKIHGDPRVTRVGRVLRALSLDELPQLVNVVRGEMSLVGPRPALPSEVERYDELARRRLVVRPGITGLWQVSGRSDLDWEQSVALDAHYVDNVGITSDLRICLATVRAVVSRKGAY